MNGFAPVTAFPQPARIFSRSFLRLAAHRVRKTESGLRAKHVTEPRLFIDDLPSTGKPTFARKFDAHLTPRAVRLVHPVEFPVSFALHHPARTDATHHIGNISLCFGTLFVTAPVLKMQIAVKAREICSATQARLPHHHPLKLGGLFALNALGWFPALVRPLSQ